MRKQNLKDNSAQIIVIIIAGAIMYGVNQFTANDSFYRNATGISFELVGFLVMLWSSWQSKVKHPKTFQTGIALVSLGLFFQLLEVICVESPIYCTNS